MKLRKIIIPALAVLIVFAFIVATFYYFGILQINNPSREKYPIRGVDVSSYQGSVDWEILSSQNISFAFIKATEGSSYADPCFKYNWENAANTDLRIGAYHFFSFESGGQTQAKNFIDTVEAVDNMLPPVIDVEFYGGFSKETVDADKICRELRIMIDCITEHYGIKPILYVTADSKACFLNNGFDDCDLWYRSVYGNIDSDIDWKFWQFSNRFKLKGYDGEEKFIDMNVFYGTESDFEFYP